MNGALRRARMLVAASAVAALTGVAPAMAVDGRAWPGVPDPADRAPGQIEAGTLATWGDMSTWTRPAPGVPGAIEAGLGLVLAGPHGEMRLAFYAVRSPQAIAAARPPASIGVRVAAGPRMNPNLIHTPTLTITYGGPDQEDVTIDMSSTMAVDNPAPGAWVTSGITSMPAERFLEMTTAEEIAASIFGADVVLREDQIEAVRAFRDRVFPTTPR